MLSKFYNRKQYLIGIDLSPGEVRLLQLKAGKSGMGIAKMGITDLARGAIIDGIIHKKAEVHSAIKQVMLAAGVDGGFAAIALPFNSVMTKQIRLAESLTAEECRTEMEANLDYYLPGVSGELCFDFMLADAQNGTLYAARQQQVSEYMAVVAEAGLTVKIVDIDAHAIMRGASLFIAPEQLAAILNVDIGSGHLIIFRQTEIIYNQSFNLEQLEQQIRSVLQFCQSTQRNLKLDSLVLSGKVSCLQELSRLANEFQFSIQLANPLSALILDKESDACSAAAEEISSRMLICCGLALRGSPSW